MAFAQVSKTADSGSVSDHPTDFQYDIGQITGPRVSLFVGQFHHHETHNNSNNNNDLLPRKLIKLN